MKIIHGKGFDMSERLEKISDIRKNIQQSIVVLLTAMKELEIPFAHKENEKRKEFILNQAGNPESHKTNVSFPLVFISVLFFFYLDNTLSTTTWICNVVINLFLYTGIPRAHRTSVGRLWSTRMLQQISWIPAHWLC